tara:strand:+ start:1732 stop:1899 length:168 start_codon:yes stop_codon:yes gene_type:complete
MYSSITTAIQEILNKDIKTIRKEIEENDTTTSDVAIVDKPLLKKKKVVKRDSLEN